MPPPMPIEEAIALLLDHATPLERTASLPLIEAEKRVLARDLTSPLNVPPHDNSAMDGYAIRREDLATSKETRLPVSQRINAGSVGTPLEAGTAAQIFTGAPIPPNADAVVMQEKTRCEGDDVILSGPVNKGNNIRPLGEDIAKGDTVLRKGDRLTPQALGLAASIGHADIEVFERPRVAVLCTGDELANPGDALLPGQIYNSNRFTMRALLHALGCEVLDMGIVEDTHEATKAALEEAASRADLVLTSGGVSVGEEDHVRNVVEELGSLNLWRLNIKPGKPLAFGSCKGVPLIGLPGNPVSVFVTFVIAARPFILKLMGADKASPAPLRVRAGFDWPVAKKRREYLRVRLALEKGEASLLIYPHQGSGVLSSVAWADGLAIAMEGQSFKKGDLIDYLPFDTLLA